MKKYFKLMSLFLGLMVCATSFVACGDDGDDTPSTNTPQKQTLVGHWKGYIPATDSEDMAGRYAHYLYYYFGQDNKFIAMTSFFDPSIGKEKADNYIQKEINNGKTTTSFDFGGEIIYFEGTYKAENGTIKFNVQRNATYNSYDHKWYGGSRGSGSKDELEINYQLGDNSLTLSSNNEMITHFAYHHTLVGKLEKVASTQYPDVPEPNPIIGSWQLDNTGDSLTVVRNFDEYDGCSLVETKLENGEGYSGNGRFIIWDKIETADNGRFVLEDGKAIITYTYRSIHYYKDGRSIEAVMENYQEGERPTVTLVYSINGNKMNIDGKTWTKRE